MNDQNNEMIGKKLTEVMGEIPQLKSEKLDKLLSQVTLGEGHTDDKEIMEETFRLLNS